MKVPSNSAERIRVAYEGAILLVPQAERGPVATVDSSVKWTLSVALGVIAGQSYPQLGAVEAQIRQGGEQIKGFLGDLLEGARAAIAARDDSELRTAAQQMANGIQTLGPKTIFQATADFDRTGLREAVRRAYPEPQGLPRIDWSKPAEKAAAPPLQSLPEDGPAQSAPTPTPKKPPAGKARAGSDPKLVDPGVPLAQILALVEQRLQQVKSGDLLAGITGKWEPAERELARLRQAQDTADNRRKARSLLTSLGGSLPDTPAPLRPDAGDAAARSRTYGQEFVDQAEIVGEQLQQGAQAVGQGLQTGLYVVGGVVLAGGALALVYALAMRKRRRRRRDDE